MSWKGMRCLGKGVEVSGGLSDSQHAICFMSQNHLHIVRLSSRSLHSRSGTSIDSTMVAQLPNAISAQQQEANSCPKGMP